jgi:hypothetical protein
LRKAQQDYSKKRFPHRFLPSTAALVGMHAKCQSHGRGEEIHLSCQLSLAKEFVTECEVPPPIADIPVADSIAIRSDSRYLFGYWNKA